MQWLSSVKENGAPRIPLGLDSSLCTNAPLVEDEGIDRRNEELSVIEVNDKLFVIGLRSFLCRK